MKYGKLEKSTEDEEEEKEIDIEDHQGKNKLQKTTKVNFDGHLYDLEDGHLVNYIEIYVPFLRKYIKINSCKFFQYLFGKTIHFSIFNFLRFNHSFVQHLAFLFTFL